MFLLFIIIIIIYYYLFLLYNVFCFFGFVLGEEENYGGRGQDDLRGERRCGYHVIVLWSDVSSVFFLIPSKRGGFQSFLSILSYNIYFL